MRIRSSHEAAAARQPDRMSFSTASTSSIAPGSVSNRSLCCIFTAIWSVPQVETLAHPVRSPEGGEIRIAVRATERIIKSVQEGLKGMSVEFFALAESRAGAVREITRALIQGAALVANPEYQQGRAEVRERRRRGLWL